MPRLIGCARCRRAFTVENPRYRPRGRYCESCAITLGGREWCHHCRQAVAPTEYDYRIWRCAACRRERMRAAYWRDPEKARARVRARYPERRETARRWNTANRARKTAYWHAYQARRMLEILRGKRKLPG